MTLLNEIFGDAPSREQGDLIGPILAVDIGSVYTRAVLLDVVEGGYRFVSHGHAVSTAGEPWNDVLIGVYDALGQVANATGRELIDDNGDLILAPRPGMPGVGAFVATASAGQPIRALLFGLIPSYSLRSGTRAAESIYLSLLDTFGLDDPRTVEEQVRVLLNANADLILVVGGTDGGAVGVLREHLEALMLAYSVMKRHARPPVLFAGNRALRDEVREASDALDFRLLVAENVRPALDTEFLTSAQEQLVSLYNEKKAQNTPGIAEVASWTSQGVQPTAHGFGRMVHLLGGLRKGNVLGVDLGSMATTVAVSLEGRQYLNVFSQLGMGHSAREIALNSPPQNIARWLMAEDVTDEDILNYLWNKSMLPQTIPATEAELEIEYGAAREVLRQAVLSARQSWPNVPDSGRLPHFNTLLLSGSTLTNTPTDGWSLLIALDALLPIGTTRVLLDPYGLAAALGAAAPLSPQAAVQSLDAGAFYDLGPVICLSGRIQSAVRGRVRPAGSDEATVFEIPAGMIGSLPLGYGQKAELSIEGGGLRRKMTVTGGALGVVIDARGRPWRLPRDDEARRDRLREWHLGLLQEDRS